MGSNRKSSYWGSVRSFRHSAGYEMERTNSYDMAFVCLAMLLAPQRLSEVLAILPDCRQRSLRECLAQTSGWSAAVRGRHVKALWRTDIMETARRCGQDGHMHGQRWPVPLERWLYSRTWESDGSQNY